MLLFSQTFNTSRCELQHLTLTSLFTSSPNFLCAGEPASDHEEGRNTDTQPQNVQQVQKEQAAQRQLRGVFKKLARQERSLQRRLSRSHDHGPLATF